MEVKSQSLHTLHHSEVKTIFWDNLAKSPAGIPLTANALHELNRRNRQAEVEDHKTQQPSQHLLSAPDFLARCSQNTLKQLKIFSRQGGPQVRSRIVSGKPIYVSDSMCSGPCPIFQGSISRVQKVGHTIEHFVNISSTLASSRLEIGPQIIKSLFGQTISMKFECVRDCAVLPYSAYPMNNEMAFSQNWQTRDGLKKKLV